MKYLDDYSNIFTRYDLIIEVACREALDVSQDAILQKVANCVVSGDEEGAAAAVREALEKKSPMAVINEALIPAMQEVSRLWDEGVNFLPQVILASDAMNTCIALCEEKMGKTMDKKAKIVTHTAEGDIHDIGQVIVNALLNANGFEVINLGADVPVDKVVESCRIHNPIMVTGTALMTTTMTAFPKIAAQLKRLSLNIPFVCGGGAVSEEYVTSFELGIWGKEANQAPLMAADALSGSGWKEMRGKYNYHPVLFGGGGVSHLPKPYHQRPLLGTVGRTQKEIVSMRKRARQEAHAAKRHTMVEFPRSCRINVPAVLKIQLTIESPPLSLVELILCIPFKGGEDETVLLVYVTAPSFRITTKTASMRIPMDRNSDPIEFELIPLASGWQQIEVELFSGGDRVGYFTIETQVSREESHVTIFEDPARMVFRDVVQDDDVKPDERMLFVTRVKDVLLFSVRPTAESEEVFDAGEVPIPGGDATIVEFNAEITKLLQDIAGMAFHSPEAQRSQLMNLQAWGAKVFEWLFPPKLQDLINGWKNGAWVGVTSNDDFVPWELLHDKHGFLGDRFKFYRLPRKPLGSGVAKGSSGRSSSDVTLGHGKIVHVIGGGLRPNRVEQCKRHFKKVPNPDAVRTLEAKFLSEVLDAFKEAHLLHFTCHGLFDPIRLQVCPSDGVSGNLTIDWVRHGDFQMIEGCIVFANACSSAAPGVEFGKFLSLGWEFYMKGAGVFIGTLGTIPTDNALSFAQAFYDAFIASQTGNTLSALHTAKRKTGSSSPLHLLYSVYGNPRRTPTVIFH